MKKKSKFVIFLVVTLLVFYLIFQKIDYLSLGKVLLNANLLYLAAVFSLVLLIPVFSAKKWQKMVGAMDYPLSFKDSFKIIMAAYPVSAVTPAKSGDLIRAYYLKDKLPSAKTMGAVITERFIDLWVLAFYSFIGSLVLKNGLILAISLSVIFLIFLFFFLVHKMKLPFLRWREKAESFLSVFRVFVQKPKKLLPVLFYAVIFWSIPIFEAKLLFLALGADISLFYIAAAFPLAIFVGLIPVTIAGMGTRDSAIIYFFGFLAEPSVCLGVGILYSFFAYWFLALLGLPLTKKLL